MKRFWQLLMMTPLLFVTFGNTPVYAERSDQATLGQSASVRQDQILVNAIEHKMILVKDKRIFQENFLRTVQQYALKSSTAPIAFQEPHAFYCSGFAQEIYRANGIWIPGNSLAQQTKFGVRINQIDKVETGDLIFFSGPSSNKVPAHVAIALGNGKVLHASGADKGISLTEINDDLRAHFMFATRLVSSV